MTSMNCRFPSLSSLCLALICAHLHPERSPAPANHFSSAFLSISSSLFPKGNAQLLSFSGSSLSHRVLVFVVKVRFEFRFRHRDITTQRTLINYSSELIFNEAHKRDRRAQPRKRRTASSERGGSAHEISSSAEKSMSNSSVIVLRVSVSITARPRLM